MTRKYLFLVILLAILTASTSYGWYVRAVEGLKVTALSPSFTAWGLWIAFYIFFAGLSAGAFLVSSLVYGFNFKDLEKVGRYALIVAILSLLGAFLSVLPDLGRMDRFIYLYTSPNFSSWMAIEAWMYVVYVLILLSELYFACRTDLVRLKSTTVGIRKTLYSIISLGSSDLSDGSQLRDRKVVRILAIVGIPVAANGGTGAIFGVLGWRAMWFGGYTPIHFVLSAMLSGAAFLLATYIITNRALGIKVDSVATDKLRDVVLLLLFIEWFFVFWELVTSFWPTAPQENTLIASLLVLGPYWWVFWIDELLIGFLIPAALLLYRPPSKAPIMACIAGLMIVLGIIGIKFNIVLPALNELPLPNMPLDWDIKSSPWTSIPGVSGELWPNLGAGLPYFPSLWEILVEVSSISLLILLYVLLVKIIPLEEVLKK
ncbi:MAG: NrfD/PsrC family molybdoenzyme membrane anchor subunit [Thermofilum sp.]